ncbi:MAG: hypothetical protein BWY25_00570 [Chloroflexi bacterium ADurb.Bin222]|nr:MAG: hypothetical protein BWY25_00570 [Chloroflexi bacterium ADurb.Bin222]
MYVMILVTAAVAAALTLLLYHDALQLPLWADDLLQVPWVKATPLRDLWRTVGPYEDYRPLHFSLWRGIVVLTGALAPATLHLLNLVGHGLSSLLVGLLAARISKRPFVAALLGVSFFGLFPFAYDTVLWVSSFSYPLSLILTVSAVLLYSTARETGKVSLYIPVLLLTALAGFAYEGGVMAGPSVLLAEICLQQRPFSRWSLVVFAASMLPFAAVTAVSPAVPTQFLTGLHPIYNLVIALQCLIFPLAPLAMPLAQVTGRSAIAILVLMGLLWLAGIAVLSWQRRQQRVMLFGLGWTVLWSLIPLSTQAFNWYRDPPRVFYLSAVGIAVIWACLLEQLPPQRWSQRWRVAMQSLLSLMLLLPGGVFLYDEVALHDRIGDLLWATAREAETTPGTLFINLPGRITFAERRYPLGHEGAIPLPPPTSGEMFVAVHSANAQTFRARSMSGLLPPELPYTIEPADSPVSGEDLRKASHVLLVTFNEREMSLLPAGAIRAPEPLTAYRAAFRPPTEIVPNADVTVYLLTAQCQWSDPDSVEVTIEWQIEGALTGFSTMFTHWLAPNGALDTQADGDALRGLYPLTSWQPGEVVQEFRTLRGIITSTGQIALGIWDPVAGVRWQATDAEGAWLTEQYFRLEHCSGYPRIKLPPPENDPA